MIYKGLLTELGLNIIGVVTTVLALSAFLFVVVWAYRRPQQQIDAAANLWKDDEN